MEVLANAIVVFLQYISVSNQHLHLQILYANYISKMLGKKIYIYIQGEGTQLEQASFSSLDFPPGSLPYTVSFMFTIFSKIITNYCIHCQNLSAILDGTSEEHWVSNQKPWVLILFLPFISHVNLGKPHLSSFINNCTCLFSHTGL